MLIAQHARKALRQERANDNEANVLSVDVIAHDSEEIAVNKVEEEQRQPPSSVVITSPPRITGPGDNKRIASKKRHDDSVLLVMYVCTYISHIHSPRHAEYGYFAPVRGIGKGRFCGGGKWEGEKGKWTKSGMRYHILKETGDSGDSSCISLRRVGM
jgi:hypothetical protein